MLAYLRVLADPDDEVSARRIVNMPRRGIGGTSVSRLAAWAQFNHVSFSDAVDRAADAGLNGKALRGAEQLSKTLAELRPLMHTIKPADFVHLVADRTGYRAELVAEHTHEADSRIENLAEMASPGRPLRRRPGILGSRRVGGGTRRAGPDGHMGVPSNADRPDPAFPSLPRAGLVAHDSQVLLGCLGTGALRRRCHIGHGRIAQGVDASPGALDGHESRPASSVAEVQLGSAGPIDRNGSRSATAADGLAFQPGTDHCGAERRSSHQSAPQGFTCAAGHRWTHACAGSTADRSPAAFASSNELSPG